MRLFSSMQAAIAAQQRQTFCWVPVFLGVGIALYFALRVEPGPLAWSMLFLLVLLALGAFLSGRLTSLSGFAVLILAGIGLAGLRTEMVREPVLDFRYYGPIEGRIVAVDRSASDAVRLTLDRVVLNRVAPDQTPDRVRVSLHGPQGFLDPEPGLTVMMTGNLSPPSGPVEPGGFDFRRHAWFQGLGAVGYTRTPALALAASDRNTPLVALYRLRLRIAARVREAVPGRAGPFAAAILVGDRSGIDAAVLADLRASNLAHLLAISGMHMGMLTGVVFAVVRLLLAMVPMTALHWPSKKIAAGAAIAAGAIYLALSGGNVATERAFIMVAVMLGALLIDRRALTLRAVALAAVIVLIRRPEAILSPGFQMSFAATTALVAAFGSLRDFNLARARNGAAGKTTGWVFGLVLSSAVAGLATAPYAAASFNQVPHYGLVANVLSVPVMGLLIMPAAVLAVLLAPFGLETFGLSLMAPGINWILEVADRVAELDGALSYVVKPAPLVLPALTLSGLVLILWQGRLRIGGAAGIAASLIAWSMTERPDLLISDTGGLVGLMTPEGRVLSKPNGESFVARGWLENDGDPSEQPLAYDRAGLDGKSGNLRFDLGSIRVAHLTGRGVRDRIEPTCGEAQIVIASQDWTTMPTGCAFYSPETLQKIGAIAVYLDEGKARIVTVRDRSGARPWSPR